MRGSHVPTIDSTITVIQASPQESKIECEEETITSLSFTSITRPLLR